MSTFSIAGTQGGERDQLLRALSDCKHYASGFLRQDGQFSDGGLIFVGPPGVGKTHLAVAVLAELIRTYRVRARFVDFTSLIHAIQSTFDPMSSSSKRQVLDPVTNAELLVLDELGAQKPTRFVWETLYLIMNTRYSRRLPTIFTTNYRLDDAIEHPSLDRGPDASPRRERLSDRIGDVLMSRLYEMAKPVVIDAAPDYRREFMAHQHRT